MWYFCFVGSAAILAQQLDDSLGGSPVQVRVTQGKEPAFFRQLFHGRLIVHAGGVASSWKNKVRCWQCSSKWRCVLLKILVCYLGRHELV